MSSPIARVEREFERIGLLLRHDAHLPSFTALVVGAPVRGSWWAHPRAHEIYDLLQEFDRGSGALFAKLVNAKITYVHRRLWPALLGVAGTGAAWQRDGLSSAARAVLEQVEREGAVRSDQLQALPRSERTAAVNELETRLLVHSASVHTETGAHRKLLRTWSRWCADRGEPISALASDRAQQELTDAAEQLSVASGRAVKLPWSSSTRRL
jgi:hypothetical protein